MNIPFYVLANDYSQSLLPAYVYLFEQYAPADFNLNIVSESAILGDFSETANLIPFTNIRDLVDSKEDKFFIVSSEIYFPTQEFQDEVFTELKDIMDNNPKFDRAILSDTSVMGDYQFTRMRNCKDFFLVHYHKQVNFYYPSFWKKKAFIDAKFKEHTNTFGSKGKFAFRCVDEGAKHPDWGETVNVLGVALEDIAHIGNERLIENVDALSFGPGDGAPSVYQYPNNFEINYLKKHYQKKFADVLKRKYGDVY